MLRFCSSMDDVMAPIIDLGLVVVPSALQLKTWNWDTRWAWPDYGWAGEDSEWVKVVTTLTH